MWIVYNVNDSWEVGYSVSNETEAREICENDTEMTFAYIGMTTMACM